MVHISDRPTKPDQHFIHSGMTWDEFKVLQSLFEALGVRVSYFQGEVELLTLSDLHGIISGNLGFLLELYMTEQDLDFFGTEDYSIEAFGTASAQADKSYCFGERRSVPDLAVEIVIKRERETKLNRYAALGVLEVWFWINGQIKAYRLDGKEYVPIQQSGWVPELDLQRLARCAAIERRLEAIRAWNRGDDGMG
ncbi:MAG: Uma2 family endonuclease [Cyanobacteria bacterium P01_F01_bin.150]